MSEVANDNHAPIPVTVLTGFLGAGKTTLLKYLLQAEHGMKIAVIENEYSETPIDGQLLGVEPVQVMTLSNGCVCCSINTDLEKALFLLLERRDNGEIDFDRLVIECTGLADPAPVAQTFFADEELCQRYVLDGIITLVDAANAERHLQETIAQAQVGFADRILVSKTDLVDAATFEALGQRGPGIGLRPLRAVAAKDSSDRIGTLVLRSDTPLDLERLSEFMDDLLQWHGNSLLRYKGVLNIADEPRRLVFQGVLRLYGFDWDSEWRDDEARESVIVFIGDNLPEDSIREGFERIVEGR